MALLRRSFEASVSATVQSMARGVWWSPLPQARQQGHKHGTKTSWETFCHNTRITFVKYFSQPLLFVPLVCVRFGMLGISCRVSSSLKHSGLEEPGEGFIIMVGYAILSFSRKILTYLNLESTHSVRRGKRCQNVQVGTLAARTKTRRHRIKSGSRMVVGYSQQDSIGENPTLHCALCTILITTTGQRTSHIKTHSSNGTEIQD